MRFIRREVIEEIIHTTLRCRRVEYFDIKSLSRFIAEDIIRVEGPVFKGELIDAIEVRIAGVELLCGRSWLLRLTGGYCNGTYYGA